VQVLTLTERQERALLVALTLLVGLLYLWMAPVTTLGGDNAEFVTLSARGGVAHPSGYPLYVLYLRALSWLPGAGAAHTAALATSLCGMLLVPALVRAARAWGAGPLGSVSAGALYAVGPLPLLIHTQAEVFALNGLLCALILWWSAPQGPWRGARRGLALAGLAGLALSNHLSSVWMAPVGLYGAALGFGEASPRGRAALLGLAPVALALGLTPYLTIPWMAQGSPQVWGDPQTLGDVVAHFLRRDYGTFSLSASAPKEPVRGANLWALCGSMGRGLLWVPALVGVCGLLWGLRGGAASRGGQAALCLTWLAVGVGFVSLFNIDPRGVGLHVVERFHLLPTLVLSVGAAQGMSALGSRWPGLVARWSRPAAALGLVAMCVLGGAGLSLEGVGRRQSPAVERYLRHTLLGLPPGAVLISAGDHRFFGFAYLQAVEGMRPDVLCVDWAMLSYPWYKARLDARLGAPLVPEGEGLASQRMTAGLLATGRPVFLVAGSQENIVARFPSYPLGPLARVLPVGEAPPDPYALARENEAYFARLSLDYAPPAREDGWPADVHGEYAQPWWSLAAAFAGLGDEASAEAARRRALALAPWSGPGPAR
jgi:hypothetical protein